jgi:hypothetical protein
MMVPVTDDVECHQCFTCMRLSAATGEFRLADGNCDPVSGIIAEG